MSSVRRKMPVEGSVDDIRFVLLEDNKKLTYYIFALGIYRITIYIKSKKRTNFFTQNYR